ncbi:equilibrative nucleoside transporter 1 [Cylas formicarius]|uniref:equilibrative nucleoside transporter 1 n=1 Tax=Cylas formicarius TaxID=197179 RepID=UPI002958334A|nr:equilibrative nucleoside transporter 1 [Cylas formicarius]
MSSRQKDYLHNEEKSAKIVAGQGRDGTDERTRLQKPVKLQPSWEENNLPEDELNFKNLTMDDASLQVHTPPDKYNLVYITFLIHGIGTLMPWNMFITAMGYFTDHKLARDYIGFSFPHLTNFMQILTFCSQVPNVLFNWLNIFVHIGGDLTTRIVWSISINVVVFIITIVLAMVDSSEWPHTFFWTTMVTVVVLNMANGIYQNTIYGMAAKLPPKYTGAVILGNNISGTFVTIVSILSDAMTGNKRMAAIYYFITALFVLLVGFDTYFALPLNRFYRHYELKAKKNEELRKREAERANDHTPYLHIVKKALPQLYNVWFIFFVTLGTFPAIQANVKRVDTNFFIPDKWYSPITCFLTFNVFAMIGSMMPTWFIWPSAKYLWIPVTLRFLYIPFYLLCNYHLEGLNRALPVLVTNDWVYWIVAITMALTSGYFSSVAMMYVPGTVEDRYASTAGMFGGAALITGIFSGILLTFLWPWFITHVGY